MKLLNPNLGETIDRLTILERKIVEGRRQGKMVGSFQLEANALYTHLGTLGLPAGFLPQFLRLAALNAAIWDATDHMRIAVVEDCVAAAAAWGTYIFNWNNERAAIVAELGKSSGEVDAEKLYELPSQLKGRD